MQRKAMTSTTVARLNSLSGLASAIARVSNIVALEANSAADLADKRRSETTKKGIARVRLFG